MSIPVSIVILILAGILTLVALVFGIISLAQGKQKNGIIWAVILVVAIVLVVISVMNIARGVGSKIAETVEWAKENQNNILEKGDDDFSKLERQDWLDTLQKYTSENAGKDMPAGYYKNEPVAADANGNQVLPFVYPLSIRYNSENYLGDIINDVTDSVYLQNVSQMAFDENFVIARVDNTASKELLKQGRGEIEYVLFDMRTREFLSFVNQEQLIEKAGKIGYTGSSDMKYLSDSFRGWIEYPTYE